MQEMKEHSIHYLVSVAPVNVRAGVALVAVINLLASRLMVATGAQSITVTDKEATAFDGGVVIESVSEGGQWTLKVVNNEVLEKVHNDESAQFGEAFAEMLGGAIDSLLEGHRDQAQ